MLNKMKTIIAGSRNITSPDIINRAMEQSLFIPTYVLSGKAIGVDRLGELWATVNNIPILYYPADWNKYGKSAGYKRNEEMAKNASALVSIWDGVSKGTKHMINLAVKYKLKIYIYRTDKFDECIECGWWKVLYEHDANWFCKGCYKKKIKGTIS